MTPDEDEPVFDSPQEEAAHYREKYRRILDMLDETRAELDEFQQSSKELEDELERELSATEKVQTELRERIARLESEKEDWMAKHVALQRLHSSTVGNMQREMDNLRSERDKTLIALRDLEMGNDELERNERVAVSSLLDLESKYNRAIEEKTLLEQEVILRQELEEENQRLKDDIRDANNEITILRDQIAKAAVPTPPSSVSVSRSPIVEPVTDLPEHSTPTMKHQDPVSKRFSTDTRRAISSPPLRPSLSRSNTTSSIPGLASPSIKRMSMRPPDSPLGPSNLARSTTTRNLASQAASPGSPAPPRVSPIPPARAQIDRNHAARTRGFKLLHDLQSKLGSAQSNLARAPKRLTSGNIPGITKRAVSGSTLRQDKPEKEEPVRPQPPSDTHTPECDKSGATFLSPNGWVLVSDTEETPPAIGPISSPYLAHRPDPNSPLVQAANYRSASSASAASKPLPTRPGIPSPLAASLSRSATASNLARSTRAPTIGRAMHVSSTVRPESRTDDRRHMASRPKSPSMLPQLTRSQLRAPTPTFGQAIAGSASGVTPSNRPPSRSAHRSLGRGPPPVPTKSPSATTQPQLMATPTAIRRSSRRSSLGPGEVRASGIPTPSRTPSSRPISMHTYDGTPPPVPRIPSAHKRAASRDELGVSTRDRTKSAVGRV